MVHQLVAKPIPIITPSTIPVMFHGRIPYKLGTDEIHELCLWTMLLSESKVAIKVDQFFVKNI